MRRKIGTVSLVALLMLVSPANAARPQTVPALREWVATGGKWTIARTPRIVVSPADRSRLHGEAAQLAADLARLGRQALVVTRRGARARPGDVVLARARKKSRLGREGYRLDIGQTFRITAPTRAGSFYGGRTLLQLLRGARPIPRGRARDWPRYPERGLMIDLGRRSFSPRWIRAHIRELGYLKLNLFHWHLTDDQRWGIESDADPGLASAGHLTKRQVRELVALAARHHVTIVPEIDMPGHMGALLRRHPSLALAEGKLDITDPDAFALVRKLIGEYLPLFPGRYWHLGADEFLPAGQYGLHPQLLDHARREYGPSANAKDALLGFVNRVARLVRARGKIPRAWHDELGDGSAVDVHRDVIVEWWTNISPLSDLTPPTPHELLRSGHRIMNAGWFPTYFTGDIGPVRGRTAPRRAYENWRVNRFFGPEVGERILEPRYRVSPREARNVGSKINAWDNRDLSAGEIAAGIRPRLRVIAQKTWGSRALTPSYARFQRIFEALGRAPGFDTGR